MVRVSDTEEEDTVPEYPLSVRVEMEEGGDPDEEAVDKAEMAEWAEEDSEEAGDYDDDEYEQDDYEADDFETSSRKDQVDKHIKAGSNDAVKKPANQLKFPVDKTVLKQVETAAKQAEDKQKQAAKAIRKAPQPVKQEKKPAVPSKPDN